MEEDDARLALVFFLTKKQKGNMLFKIQHIHSEKVGGGDNKEPSTQSPTRTAMPTRPPAMSLPMNTLGPQNPAKPSVIEQSF